MINTEFTGTNFNLLTEHLYDGVILLYLPQFFTSFLSYSSLVRTVQQLARIILKKGNCHPGSCSL